MLTSSWYRLTVPLIMVSEVISYSAASDGALNYSSSAKRFGELEPNFHEQNLHSHFLNNLINFVTPVENGMFLILFPANVGT